MVNQTEITRLLMAWSGGDSLALDRLLPLIYTELRRIAASYLRRERSDHTLQPTALVHEAYLKLIDQNLAGCAGRAQFFAIAAKLMRQILVNHAEAHRAAKRGGGNKVPIDTVITTIGQQDYDLVALHQALTRLSEIDQRQGEIVELRFFGGLNESEIAGVLNISTATVKRDWRMAKLTLHNQLSSAILD